MKKTTNVEAKLEPPADVDAYIAGFPREVQPALEAARAAVRSAAPDAQERISYRMPAYFDHGIVAYFGGFAKHVGFYPPISGDPDLIAEASTYANDKGNLRFPLDAAMPVELVSKIVAGRVKRNREKAGRPKAAGG